MQIQFTLDTANRKDVELAHQTLSYMAGFLPVVQQPSLAMPALATAVSTPEAPPAAHPVAKALPKDAPLPEAPKAAKVSKKKAVEAAAPAPTAPTEDKLDFTAVKAKLQVYSEDARFGMDGVYALLSKYDVARVSALPEDQYEAFVKEIDEALASKADPLA